MEIIYIIFGKPNELMYTGLFIIMINMIIKLLSSSNRKEKLIEVIRELIGYGFFIAIGVRIDGIVETVFPNVLTPVLFLVWIHIIVRNMVNVLDYLKSKGIEIPSIIESTIKRLGDYSKQEEDKIKEDKDK